MFNMDCFRPVGLYSDRVHVIWIAFIALTDKLTLLLRCIKLFGEAMSSYAGFNGKLHAMIRLACLAASLVHR